GVGQAAADVVDQDGAGVEGGLGHLGAGGVDADPDAVDREVPDDRQDPVALLRRVDPVGARAGGLPAHVDVVRAGGAHLQAVSHGGVVVGVVAAVGEAVRRDVQDAHHHAV